MPYHYPIDGAGEWELTDAQIAAWQQVYTGVDVDCELRKAWAWLDANPSRRKTARGMKRFLVAWLNRSQPTGDHADVYGHVPPCESWTDCRARALREAKGQA